MNSLPLPKANYINSIIHISDIHIKLGDLEKSHYIEYESVFNNLGNYISKLPHVIDNSTVCIFTGDFFHFKNRLDSLSIKLFNMLIKVVTSYMPLYIIQGNHDFLQTDGSIPDVLSSLLFHNVNPLVYYINQTGLYVANNMGIGHVSIKDTLKIGNGSGYTEHLPHFPNSNEFPSSVTTKIALLHGAVNNSKLFNGMHVENAIPIDWIKNQGYHIALLGDIHKSQVSSQSWDNQFTYGYAGSLLQLDFGEDPFNHGFLLWDLVNHNVQLHKIPASHIYLNISHINNQLVTMIDKNSIPITQLDLSTIKHAYIKFKGNIPTNLSDQVNQYLHDKNISYNIIKTLTAINYNTDNPIVNQLTNIDISQYNSPDMWINYIQQSNESASINQLPWKQWISDPHSLLLKTHNIQNTELSQIIHDRDIKLSTIIDTFNQSISYIKNTHKPILNIRLLQWDYILCYGPNNFFNFDLINNKICCINGKNSSGKTSFLEILTYGLFGQDFPSRKAHSSTIICTKKPVGVNPQITVFFNLDNTCYKINRVLNIPKTGCTHTKSISLDIVSKPNGDIINNISTSTVEIDKWINTHIGSFNNFIMSCVITQMSDADFFSLKDKEQLQLLDSVLHVDIIDNIINIFKETQLALNAVISLLQSLKLKLNSDDIESGVNQQMIDTLHNQIQTHRNDVNKYTLLHDNIKQSWHDIPINDILSDDQLISYNINKFQSLYNSKYTDLNIDMILQNNAVLIDKLQSLNNQHPNIDPISYNDHVVDQLQKLLDHPINRPPLDLQHFNSNLTEIDKWMTVNRDILSLSSTEIGIEIDQIKLNINDLEKQYQLLIDNKPNQPDINISQYNQSITKYKQVIHNISLLNKQFTCPDEIVSYCNNHPLPIINKNHSVKTLQNKLNAEIAKLRLLSWYTEPLENLEKLRDDKQLQLDQLNHNIEQYNTEKSTIDSQMSSINAQIDVIDQQIASIGFLGKPNIPLFKLNSLIEQFNNNQKLEPSKHEELQELEIQLDKSIKTNQLLEYNTNKLQLINNEIQEIESLKIPFNPDCYACQQQSWKKKHLLLIDQQNQINHWISDNPPVHNIDSIKQQINNISLWINSFKQQQTLVQSYTNMVNDWEVFIKNNETYNSLKTDKTNKQQIISKFKVSLEQINQNIKLIDTQKIDISGCIYDLQYAINNRNHWIQLQTDIDNIQQWNQEHHIHELCEEYKQINYNQLQQQKLLIDNNITWKQQINNNRLEYDSNQSLLNQLQSKLNIIQLLPTYNSRKTDCLQQISNWNQFNQYQHTLISLKKTVLSKQITGNDQTIENIRLNDSYNEQLTYWKNIIKIKADYIEKNRLNQQIKEINQLIHSESIQYEKYKIILDQYNKKLSSITHYSQLIEELSTKRDAIDIIHKLLDNYHIWLYTNIVIPHITQMINQTTNIITESSDFSLIANVSTKRNGIDIQWSINGPTGTSCIEKAGGFRKYIYGLIMRISLARMGCSHINNSQLFIDEGFTASDNNNLEKMPAFLHNLIDFYRNGIVIVSHLLTIRESATIIVNINQNENNNTSLIQFDNNQVKIKKRLVFKNHST